MPTAAIPLSSTVSVLLVDLCGVVCRFQPDQRLAALAEAAHVAPEPLHAAIWGSGFDADCDRGRYTVEQIHAELNRILDRDLPYDRLCALWARAFAPDLAFLAEFDRIRAGRRAYLVSNNGPLVLDTIRMHLPDIARRFDDLLFTCRFGVLKPDPELYRRVLAHLGVSARHALFIDDSATNVLGAQQAGLHARHYTDCNDFITWSRRVFV
jgi:putative hydrolase of the HAD superfamily